MALYITTVEDICSDRNLAKTACTLCSDDLLILLLSDDSTDEWQELQMIAEKKGFHIQKETVTSDSWEKIMKSIYIKIIYMRINISVLYLHTTRHRHCSMSLIPFYSDII